MHVESFNGRLRDECLNANGFSGIYSMPEEDRGVEMSTMANGPTAAQATARRMSLPKS